MPRTRGGGGQKTSILSGRPLWMPPKKAIDVMHKGSELIMGDMGANVTRTHEMSWIELLSL